MQISCNLKALSKVIPRYFPRDLNGTPEVDTVIREKIHLPALEHAARLVAYGIVSRFLFTSKFVKRDERRSYDRTHLSDVQAQGYLLGETVKPEQAPKKVYRVVPATERFSTLTIPTSGAVFTFYADLSRDEIVSELRFRREIFLKSLGMNPQDLHGNLRLVEIDNNARCFTLFKPTNKDSGYKPFFRYNPDSEPCGQTLNLNNGESNDGFQEFVMKDLNLQSDPLKTQIAWKDI